MQIKFDSRTKFRKMQHYVLVFPEFVDEARQHVPEIIEQKRFDFFAMTIAEFLQLQENKLPERVNKLLKSRKLTFFDFLKIKNTFENGSKSLQRIIEDTTIPLTADEEAARAGLLEMTAEQSIILFLKEFYPNAELEDLQKKNLYEYITYRTKAFNDAKYQRNMINIQKIKI